MFQLIPPRPFLDVIVVRVGLLWALLRAVSGMGAASTGASPLGASPGFPVVSGYIVVVVLVALRLEMWRRSELVFLNNLGHSFSGIAPLIIAECLLLDGVLWLFLV